MSSYHNRGHTKMLEWLYSRPDTNQHKWTHAILTQRTTGIGTIEMRWIAGQWIYCWVVTCNDDNNANAISKHMKQLGFTGIFNKQ